MYANTVHFWTVYSSARTQAIPGKTVHIYGYTCICMYICAVLHIMYYILFPILYSHTYVCSIVSYNTYMTYTYHI